MERAADREGEVQALAARCNEALEEAIRRSPPDWMWIHRRWKTRPPGGKSPYSRRRGEADPVRREERGFPESAATKGKGAA
jgi:KDO2-lipid IV(A) lauroyltransferase